MTFSRFVDGLRKNREPLVPVQAEAGLGKVVCPPLTVTVLGSGTSTGVPMIGCDCAVCTSSDPRDKRMRCSLSVQVDAGPHQGENLLVDTGPEMRQQVLRAGIGRIEAALITHTHADHIFGMDDLRQFNFRHKMRIPVYGTEHTLEHLRQIFDYCFRPTQEGGGKPQLDLTPFTPYQPFTLSGVPILPLTVLHGSYPITAFKFGNRFAYVTDVSTIPDETRPHLRGLDVLILDAVRYKTHPTHFGLHDALREIKDLQPKQAYLTHLSHEFGYVATTAELPDGVELAYDGLTFSLEGDA